jgi:hypothetical protein
MPAAPAHRLQMGPTEIIARDLFGETGGAGQHGPPGDSQRTTTRVLLQLTAPCWCGGGRGSWRMTGYLSCRGSHWRGASPAAFLESISCRRSSACGYGRCECRRLQYHGTTAPHARVYGFLFT